MDSDQLCSSLFIHFTDVDDEYEDEEDQWEEGAEDILEKGDFIHMFPSCCFSFVPSFIDSSLH